MPPRGVAASTMVGTVTVPTSAVAAPRAMERRVIALLAVMSVVAYALRSDITIAQEQLAPSLGLTMVDMGVISAWGFQLAYALFQIPAGFLGDRYGARLTLGVAILCWSAASLLTGLTVSQAGSGFAMLFLARALLGVGQAATYPVSAIAAAQYVSVERRAGASGIYLASAMLGSALAPLLLAPVMVRVGWRGVFFVTAAVGLVMALVWFALFPRTAPVGTAPVRATMKEQLREALLLLGNRSLLILSVSYFLHSAVFFVFVFWTFRYLTEGRGFSVLASGVWTSVPNFMAFVIAPSIGFGIDYLGKRIHISRARRRVAMACLLVAAAFVLIGANLPSATLAILALGVSVGCISGAEASFWTAATSLGKRAAGSAGGLLNLAGNLGGVFSIWLVPIMKDAWGWTAMLGFWAAVAVAAALMWLAVREPED